MQRLDIAESGYCYRIAEIRDEELSMKLASYGLFKNSLITKVDPEYAQFATVKISTKRGTASIPGSLAKHVSVRSGRGPVKSIYELEEGKSANVTEIDGCEKTVARLKILGVEKGVRLKLLRNLPHMEYLVLVNNRVRARISEAVAASIIGESLNMHKQFSFARKGRAFTVKSVVAGEKISAYLDNIGIAEGVDITLEGIEPGKDIPFEDEGSISVYALEGFHMKISEASAEKIIVI